MPGKAADSANAGEERDRGEHDLLAVTLAQQARTAETLDTVQVPADFSFLVTLAAAGRGLRHPSAPYPRDHLSFVHRREYLQTETITGLSELRTPGGCRNPRRNALIRRRESSACRRYGAQRQRRRKVV